ncbi:hypothetical protein NOR_07736 [Metarhizium rileyi]|uniref:Uncharacterized protein n=1 Tax=Metarhizium rileyi (strain RCEF 4871) TaxID=1649241 RepID=A0A166XL23_METRR|nr:hypothetical protein NOR_07736 [Metarhizium rileyi RCEF 4871]TWU77241.1 hypothetical protein ED733_002065 [Metarhizium rileyi]
MPETSPTQVPFHPRAVEEGGNDPSARAMSTIDAWKPSFDRRQSWSKEDQKHALHMSAVDGVQEGHGFTEKKT